MFTYSHLPQISYGLPHTHTRGREKLLDPTILIGLLDSKNLSLYGTTAAYLVLKTKKTYLVGGWTNPFEKYADQIGSFPQGIGMNIKNI